MDGRIMSDALAYLMQGQPVMNDAQPESMQGGEQYATNVHLPFLVVDPRNANIVGSSKTASGATNIAERRNMQYGGQLYIPIEASQYGKFVGGRK